MIRARIKVHIVFIVFLVFLIYSQTLSSSFHFDDQASVLENPALTCRSAIFRSLWEYWPTRFLTTASMFVNYSLGGYEPSGYHLLNIAIHIGNSILVYLLLCVSLRKLKLASGRVREFAAGFGALLFALHPLQTQAVSYVSQRSVLLASFFYLASLLLYIRGVERRSHLYFSFSWLLAVLAMVSKEIAATLPLAVILWDLLFVKKPKSPRWPRFLAFSLLLLLVPVIVYFNSEHPRYNDSGQISFWAGDKHFGKIWGGIKALDRKSYALNQNRVIITYLRLFFLPVRQNLDYDYPCFFSFFRKQIVLSFLILFSTIIFVWYLIARKSFMGAYGILFFFIALLPESSFIPIRDVICEHRLYLPLVGLAFLSARGLLLIKQKRILVLLIVILLAVLTINRNRVWKDDLTLWRDTVAKSPNKARPHNQLGVALFKQGKVKEAISHYSKALQIEPDYAVAHNSLGFALAEEGKLAEAISHYTQALLLKPDYVMAYNNLGLALAGQGKLDEAVSNFSEALRIKPSSAIVHSNLGIVLARRGKLAAACDHFSEALRIKPESALVHYNLGLAFTEQGKFNKAIARFSEALRIKPEYAEAHCSWGIILANQGKFDQAIFHFTEALRSKPDFAIAAYNLKLASWKSGWPGQGSEAIRVP